MEWAISAVALAPCRSATMAKENRPRPYSRWLPGRHAPKSRRTPGGSFRHSEILGTPGRQISETNLNRARSQLVERNLTHALAATARRPNIEGYVLADRGIWRVLQHITATPALGLELPADDPKFPRPAP